MCSREGPRVAWRRVFARDLASAILEGEEGRVLELGYY
jgi:hypothetical protein